MHYFIGIVPPDEFKVKIIQFQKKWNHNRLPDLVEPHITLKAQGGLTPDEKWLSKIETVCHSFGSFTLSVEEPRFFGEDILYLSASSSGLSVLHERIVKAVLPSEAMIKRYFELEEFVPHMTLAKTYHGLSKQELKDMAKLAEQNLQPYPSLDVTFVRIYKENVSEKKYEKYLDIPLLSV